MKYFKLALLIMLIPVVAKSQSGESFIKSLNKSNAWVDSVFKKMNRNDRITQLFMVRAHTNLSKAYQDSVGEVIKKEKLGGVVFFQGGPGRQAALTNKYQSFSKVPLLIALDGEWGLGMRLDTTISFPYQMTLGAVQDNNLIYEMGRQIARDFKRIGMHINFAPVADINNNPKNPVIGYRSFGDNKYNVTEKVSAYMRGMQAEGLLVSLKHFPGHGDTDVDSHYDLPKLPFTKERLDSLEMYPFRQLIKQDASGIMVAHMSIPALDNTKNLPSTLSKPIVTGILKNDLGFKGLIFSDAMDMKGVVKFFPGGEASVRGLMAGMDIIELAGNSKEAAKMVRKAIRQKRLSWDRIDSSARKVLYAKYWAGLNNYDPVSTRNIISDVNRAEAKLLNQKLADAAVTVLKSDSFLNAISPYKKTALVSIGSNTLTTFQRELNGTFTNYTNFILAKNASADELTKVDAELQKYEQVIVSIHDSRKRPQPVLDFSSNVKVYIAELAVKNALFSVFANPYAIAGLPGIEKAKTILMNYQDGTEAEKAAAKVISKQLNATGKLPVTINTYFKNGDGINMLKK